MAPVPLAEQSHSATQCKCLLQAAFSSVCPALLLLLLLLLQQLSSASAQSHFALGCDLTGNLSKGKVTPIVEEN